MTKRHEIYKCKACGIMVEVLHDGAGKLVCCGHPMERMTENTVDAAKEKHVPVLEKVPGGWLVKVGSVAHPMEEKHYIEWVELHAGGAVYRKYLKPGERPEAHFPVEAAEATAREHCNLHGVLKA